MVSVHVHSEIFDFTKSLIKSILESDERNRAAILTYITVLSRPAWEAFTKISTNQIVAGLGIHARLVFAFIGIFEKNVWI